MTIQEKHREIVEEFLDMEDWQERYHHLVDLGKELTALSDDCKTDQFKVSGCVSQVWLKAEMQGGKMLLEADSDSIFVKGLIALLVEAYSGFPPNDVASVGSDFVREIGISENLSPNRANGLGSMIQTIENYAKEFAANGE